MTVTLSFLVAACIVLTAVPVVLAAPVPGGTLSPEDVPKFVTPLVIPPAMPRDDKIKVKGGKNIEYFEIAVRQFKQQILPGGIWGGDYPATTVWSYGPAKDPIPDSTAWGGGPGIAPAPNSAFNYPAFTIEAKYNKPVRVNWINDLVDPLTGDYLPHLLPVDQTLHWANPTPDFCLDGTSGTDCRGSSQDPYDGPVPIITHVHGAHTYEEFDGYPEAWYLPDAVNIPGDYARFGNFYNTFKTQAEANIGAVWATGEATFEYPNDQRATTLWYHDHSLGMTRLNVYAGPAGFYLLRGGPDDMVTGVLPGPAPALGDPPGMDYYEIPIAVQDRSFNEDGSLFYPDNRAFFEGLDPADLQIPFIPQAAVGGTSDVSPIWNPEFFGNFMVVNGVSWPFLNVEQRRYRFRFLNGCNSRFLILQPDNGMPFWQIGAEGGFLPAPVSLPELLMAPAERADVIMDFTDIPVGTTITLLNLGPDEPFGGGIPGVAFDPADPGTTGMVMQFKVVAAKGVDLSTDPALLGLPVLTNLGPSVATRQLSLNEEESQTVFVAEVNGSVVFSASSPVPFGPTSALLGDYDPDTGMPSAALWSDPITETPVVGDTETWEIYNFTADAHPIHVHLVQFQVVDRQALDHVDEEGVAIAPAFPTGLPMIPEMWETGYKDTVIAYPGEVTRIIARFDIPGLYVWHCHIVEHEDNEMMRPYCVEDTTGPTAACTQAGI
jgi:FtsP/CotA-like multicopper oxidase with cupredoxin domain